MDNKDTNKVSKIMILRSGRVLLLRSKTLNKYHFPGGHIKTNETFTTGLIREVKEETNLNISSCKIVQKKPNFCLFKGWAYVGNVKLSDEHTDFIWAKIEDAHIRYPVCKYTYEGLRRLRQEWLIIKARKNRLDNEEEVE
jgi:8-oxo-dGTP pyrophosphatase MutT (NUDIX family)